MTQEEKKLLLTDLSARLMYGLMCQVDDGAAGLNDGKLVEINITKELVRFDVDYHWTAYIDDVKPYLRPMSSMTEEENKEYYKTFRAESYGRGYVYVESVKSFDWLNAHHFDYRGLIERGLAIAVTEENNPYKS